MTSNALDTLVAAKENCFYEQFKTINASNSENNLTIAAQLWACYTPKRTHVVLVLLRE